MIAYQLAPLSPFHFGERGVGQEETSEFPHSDTLLSALVIAWRLSQGDKVGEWLGPLLGPRPPVRLSSAFPYAGPVRFFPRPLIPLYGEDEAQQLDPKLGKKVEWVSWRRLEDIANSDTPPRVDAGDLLMGGRVWLHPADRRALEAAFGRPIEGFAIWSAGETETIPRVAVDRISSAPALYFQGQVRFAQGCGLYTLAEFDPPFEATYRQAVALGLALLGELGLGGRRSVGLGHFAMTEMPLEEPLEEPEGDECYHLLLSLYRPTLAEIQAGVLKDARYRLLTRRGWFFSTADAGQRRRAVRMLAEGSLLSRPATGSVVDVAPPGYAEAHHPVYRGGLALTVRCRRWSHV
jgi:CRISPR-associated protein Csm4